MEKAELLDASTTSYPVVYFKIIYPIHTQIIDILVKGPIMQDFRYIYVHEAYFLTKRFSFHCSGCKMLLRPIEIITYHLLVMADNLMREISKMKLGRLCIMKYM